MMSLDFQRLSMCLLPILLVTMISGLSSGYAQSDVPELFINTNIFSDDIFLN